MKRVDAVIGAVLGDEGKGRTVDYLCRTSPGNPLVIRYNSSAQAGHTVQIGAKRHVFSHFGSGTLRGVPTLLCHSFILNPILFNKEWDELQNIGVTPEIYATPALMITTPIDALLNQITEINRGQLRHGSCGIGFNETINRYQAANTDIQSIRRYFGFELARRKIDWNNLKDPLWRVAEDVLENQFDWTHYFDQLKLMWTRMKSHTRSFAEVTNQYDHLIFEGAQGLMLHEDHRFFPHVTRSKTGLEIPAHMCVAVETYRLNAYYCMRTYFTRHGAGPLPAEVDAVDVRRDITDLTNHVNDWQGSLRFAPFNAIAVKQEIDTDLKRVGKSSVDINVQTVVNWRDVDLPKSLQVSAESFRQHLPSPSIEGYGPDSIDTEVCSTCRV